MFASPAAHPAYTSCAGAGRGRAGVIASPTLSFQALRLRAGDVPDFAFLRSLRTRLSQLFVN
jgi:hypothetical protein